MAQTPKKTPAELREIRDELEKLADEIRLKLHLAGMDARNTWSKIEPKLHDFEQRAEQTTERIGQELRDLGTDLRKRMRKLRSEL